MSAQAVLNGVYIDGQWSAGDALLQVINPVTEAPLAQVAGAGAEAVDQALGAATRSFARWSQSSGAERATVLRTIARGVAERRERLMHLQSSNNGKPQFEAAMDVDDVIATFDYYAGLAEGLDQAQDAAVALPSADFSARLRREPCGVVG